MRLLSVFIVPCLLAIGHYERPRLSPDFADEPVPVVINHILGDDAVLDKQAERLKESKDLEHGDRNLFLIPLLFCFSAAESIEKEREAR